MLTDTGCRGAKPKATAYKLKDSNGLYLEVKPNGGKVWRYRFEVMSEGRRKESVYTIGDYTSAPPPGESEDAAAARRAGGAFTLAEARAERDRARALVKQGLSPVRDRELKRIERELSTANTVEAIAREWVRLKDWEEVTKARRLRLFERLLFPKLGKLPVDSVRPAEVLDLLKTVGDANGLTVAEELKRSLLGVFDLAVATLKAESNPAYPVRKALPANKTQHKRALTPDELGQLLRDMDEHEAGVNTANALRLVWWTLGRAGEVCGMRWDELDMDAGTWRVPADRMKKRREHVVPLPSQAVDMLRRMQAINGHRPHVFAHRDDRQQAMTDAGIRQWLKAIGWAGRFSPHATRTTGSTLLNGMGYQPDHIERQLAHIEPNAVRRTYNHADYLPERRAMMQAWADYLDSLKSGAKVTPLFKSA